VDEGAVQVHGLDDDFLADKPRFVEIVEELIEFLGDAELVIHNADFDVGFLNNELKLLGRVEDIRERCRVLDTLGLARQMHPGQRNSLDALCKRYGVDNSARDLHGALLDAQILADVYLAMTGGQAKLLLGTESSYDSGPVEIGRHRIDREGLELFVQQVPGEDLEAHEATLDFIEAQSGQPVLWRRPAETGH
jgi:DNA polymerase-3 subunit epsilon